MNSNDTRTPQPVLDRNVTVFAIMSVKEASELIARLANAIGSSSDGTIPLQVRMDRRHNWDNDTDYTNVNVSAGSSLFGADAKVTDSHISGTLI